MLNKQATPVQELDREKAYDAVTTPDHLLPGFLPFESVCLTFNRGYLSLQIASRLKIPYLDEVASNSVPRKVFYP